MAGRAKTLMSSIGFYAVSSVSARFFMFLLVPLYTFFIPPDELGYYDVCFVTVVLLMPMMTLQMREGVLRFLISEQGEERHRQVVTYVVTVLVKTSLAAIFVTGIASLIWDVRHIWFTAAFAISLAASDVFSQVYRGLGYTKTFMTVGIISSALIALISVVLIVIFNVGVEAIFLANIGGRVIAVAAAEIRKPILLRYFSAHIDCAEVGKELRRFSLPLIPSTVCLWMISSANRFFIQYLLGDFDNGQFAVVLKFSAIVETLALIFYLAWQEMAFKQYESSDRDLLYSRVLHTYVWVLAMLVIGISFGARLIYPWIIGADYQVSARYLFLLLMQSMLVLMCQFYDLGYQCAKNTKKAVPGIFAVMLLSLCCNYFLTLRFGLYGIIFTLIISYTTLLTIRVIDTRSFFRIKIFRKSWLHIAILAITGVLFFVELPIWAQITTLTAALAAMLILSPTDITILLSHLKSKFRPSAE